MMLKDEFKRLMGLFHEAAEGKTVNLEEVFKQSLHLFEHMKEQIATGTQEDKVEAMKLMTEMYNQMRVESKHILEKTGLSEEQLVSFAENPTNFTPEQWRSIQASKEQVMHAGEDLISMMKGSDHPSKKKSEGKGPTSKKSKWMRS